MITKLYKLNFLKKISFYFIILGLLILFIYFSNINNLFLSLYISSFYFLGISLGALFFSSIQILSNSYWSIIIIKIIESIYSFLPFCSITIFIILFLSYKNLIEIFPWMNEVVNNKNFFLNSNFFIIRSIIYLLLWNFFYFKIKKYSKKIFYNYIKYYKKYYKFYLGFIICFSLTFMIMSWDWIMSINHKWISTIFGWYILTIFIVIGITSITSLCIFLKKKKKILNYFNDNHLHDLSKYIFSSTLLYNYIWFSQFLLYWYVNIPEEITYFINRINYYSNLNFFLLIPNLIIPFFLLISSKIKRNYNIVFFVSIIILFSQYVNIYNIIIPELHKIYKFNFLIESIGLFFIFLGILMLKIFYFLKKEINFIYQINNPNFLKSKNYKYHY